MLYGREAERSRIGDILDGARASQSAVLVLRGEAGAGKSALLEDACARAEGMRVLRCRGVESESRLPYAGLHQLLRPLLGATAALPAPQARALRGALGLQDGAGDEWFLVSLAVLTLLAEAAEESPLLCVVDDAHWLDAASAEALVFAGRRLEAERVALLFAARDGDVRTFEAPEFEELRVGGLADDAATALLESRASLSPEARRQLISGTGGNPLALLELSASVDEDQLGGLAPLPVSARVERAFLRRVRTLPEGTRTLLLVAAAEEAGTTASVLPAAETLGAGAQDLDAAEQAGLLRVAGERLEFRHPLIRSAVYHGAPLSRRQAAHRALAAVLDDADRRAWHQAAACVTPDPGVVASLAEAGERAQRRSGFVAASAAFERAASLAGDEDGRVKLLGAAAENAWFAGRPERARTLLGRAFPVAADPADRAAIDCFRALIELNVGVPADAHAQLVRGAPHMAAVDAERGLYMLALACLAAGYAGDPPSAVQVAALARELPEPDTPTAHLLARFIQGVGAYFALDFEGAVPGLRAALQLADETDADGTLQLLGLLLIAGGAGLFLGDDVAAHRLNQRLIAFARDHGALSLLTQGVPRLALTQLAYGHWPAAAAGLQEGIALARQTGQHQVVAHMQSLLALLAALRGDDERCRALAARARELALERRLSHVSLTARWALLLLELGRGQAEDAAAQAREIAIAPLALWSAPHRIEAAARAGDLVAARAWLETLSAWARSTGARWALAASEHGAALVGDDGEAERHFRSALALHEGAGRPFDRARTELAFGEMLRRARRRVEARERLQAALERFEALGATAWAERARIELRASGQRARRRDPSTLDELTAQELQIAQFVAEGLSNRDVAAQLFLSPRTIDFHLRNVFRKLGISSRIELARLDLGAA